MIATTIKRSEAKNSPDTICHSEIGFVFKSSIVQLLYSSAKLFMVIAGIKKIKTPRTKKKNEFQSAKPAFKILKSSLKSIRTSRSLARKLK